MAYEKSFDTYHKELSFSDKMPYGKYKGKTLDWVAENDISYLAYACNELKLQVDNEVFNEIKDL